MRLQRYIFFEIIPSFLLGLLVFLFIILMFQVLRMTDLAIGHGVEVKTLAELIGYVCISLLPVLLPMSLLFSIIMTYSRLSQNSEIIAMKACGVNMGTITAPAVVLGLIIGIISAQTSFEIAPWGNRRFEVLSNRLAQSKAAANIKAGTFSDGFFDLVVYANQVDSTRGEMQNIFIYDERDPQNPLTIIAKSGSLVQDPSFSGQSILLRLNDGDIHRSAETHTKIQFKSYDIKLYEPLNIKDRDKSPQSFTLKDIRESLAENKTPELNKLMLIEMNKRWALTALCLIFAMIGVALGTQTQLRSQKAGGLILSLVVIIVYWVFYIGSESYARSGDIHPGVALWAPNFMFGIFAIWSLKNKWH
ncbi:MAG: LPS export ABC transporter permease LptF [Bdellovibrionota bacterium]